jgi:hypothetical protein
MEYRLVVGSQASLVQQLARPGDPAGPGEEAEDRVGAGHAGEAVGPAGGDGSPLVAPWESGLCRARVLECRGRGTTGYSMSKKATFLFPCI